MYNTGFVENGIKYLTVARLTQRVLLLVHQAYLWENIYSCGQIPSCLTHI